MADPDVIAKPCTSLAAACDEADALAEILWLVFLAAEGMTSRDGAALARAALLALDHVTALREALTALEATATRDGADA